MHKTSLAMHKTRSSLLVSKIITFFLINISLNSAHAQDNCVAVLKYAGVDSTIVDNEISRIKNFISNFCSSSSSIHNNYNNSSAGMDVGFKGYSIGGSTSSDSANLEAIKNNICSDQQKTNIDYEKLHREDRRATRESIQAWENCINSYGLKAIATISSEKEVIVTFSFRPAKKNEVAIVKRPYDAVSQSYCNAEGETNLSKDESFEVGPAGLHFVCRRTEGNQQISILLFSDTAFLNGANPVILVEPFKSSVELPAPSIPSQPFNSLDISYFLNKFCYSFYPDERIPNLVSVGTLRCELESSKILNCVQIGASMDRNHPIFDDPNANDIKNLNYQIPKWNRNPPAGWAERNIISYEIQLTLGGDVSDGMAIFHPVKEKTYPASAANLPPRAYGLRIKVTKNGGFKFSDFVDEKGHVVYVNPFEVIHEKCN